MTIKLIIKIIGTVFKSGSVKFESTAFNELTLSPEPDLLRLPTTAFLCVPQIFFPLDNGFGVLATLEKESDTLARISFKKKLQTRKISYFFGGRYAQVI